MSENSTYTVVVGVSPNSASPAALRWAAAEVARHGGSLIALRAWRSAAPQATPGGGGTTAGRIGRDEATLADEERRLRRDVADALGADHPAEIRLVHGDRLDVLIDASRDADLLVIDAPRRLTGTILLAHRLVYAAACPVVVMPPQVAASGEPQLPPRD